MLTVNSTINLAGQAVPNIIPAVQGDTGRVIVFTLADFTIPAGSTATYYVQKPSGEAVYNAATINDNKVTVELTAQSLAETGDNYGQVRILNGEDVVTSFDFILLVKPFRGIEAIESTTEMNIFDEAVQNAMEQFDSMLPDIIAPEFDSSTAYAAGDYVIYSGKLYQFTAAHTGAWTGTDAEETTVTEKLGGGSGDGLTEEIKQALLQIAEKVVYIDEHGQDYYDALYDALYPPADLVSISAVYTQSGTVYDTDTLDSLKADLVVTAHMSDHTTRTVTEYTLSGTLAEGTSTVTVSYGGKTDTFDVTVTEKPPYTFYDYLQGDGNAYINTGLLASTYFTLDYDHEIKVARYNAGNTRAIYGARQQWGTANARELWWNGSSGYGVNFCASSTIAVADASSKEVPITLKTTRDKKILRDGVEVSYTAGNIGSISHTGPIVLFAECTSGKGSGYKAIADTGAYAGAFGACRIYYFKVWDANGDLVADIKPALRISDNAIGMYDSVRNVFLENANDTGAFSLGNE